MTFCQSCSSKIESPGKHQRFCTHCIKAKQKKAQERTTVILIVKPWRAKK